MTDGHIHQVLGGGLIVLAIGNILAFLRTVASLGEITVEYMKLRENQKVIATKAGVELPHPSSEK